MAISQAMIMAAGLGTRLRPFTQFKTKALLPILGIPIIQFTLDSLRASGVEFCVANVHHLASETKSNFKTLDLRGVELRISDESGQLLGSGGGLKKASTHFKDEPFFLANADVLTDVDWNKLGERHKELRKKSNVMLTLALFQNAPPGGKYREIKLSDDSERILGLGNLEEGKTFFVGAAVIEPEAIQHLPYEKPCEFVPEVLIPAIQQKKAGAFLSQGSWYDIGSPELWMKTQLDLLRRLEGHHFNSKQEKLWEKRIQEFNVRIQENVWVSKRASKNVVRTVKWQPFSYWDDEVEQDRSDPLFTSVGPNAVLYGTPWKNLEYSHGIGYRGEWVQVSEV